jgi:predicted porin
LAYERLNYELGTILAPTGRRDRNWSIGLAVPIGSGAIKSQYARGKTTGTAVTTPCPAAACGTSANGRIFNLSYEYAMSKRTLLYVAYAKLTQDANSVRQFGTNLQGPNGWQEAQQAGADPRYISFGINHNF